MLVGSYEPHSLSISFRMASAMLSFGFSNLTFCEAESFTLRRLAKSTVTNLMPRGTLSTTRRNQSVFSTPSYSAGGM